MSVYLFAKDSDHLTRRVVADSLYDAAQQVPEGRWVVVTKGFTHLVAVFNGTVSTVTTITPPTEKLDPFPEGYTKCPHCGSDTLSMYYPIEEIRPVTFEEEYGEHQKEEEHDRMERLDDGRWVGIDQGTTVDNQGLPRSTTVRTTYPAVMSPEPYRSITAVYTADFSDAEEGVLRCRACLSEWAEPEGIDYA